MLHIILQEKANEKVKTINKKKLEHMPELMNIALDDKYVEQGNVEILKKEHGLDVESLIKRIVTGYVRK